MKVKVINKSNNALPTYQTLMSAGMDIHAFLDAPVELKPLERVLIPTGLFLELPKGYEAQIRPRSGLALRHGITVLNSPGTIDSDYRGEIKVLLVNLSDEVFVIHTGERIAQMVVSSFCSVEWELSDELSSTTRGDGGYGSTGK